MKKIGIIGGIGPESTIVYYRLLLKLFRERLATDQYPEFQLYSINMTEMLRLVFDNRLEELVVFLKEKIQTLEATEVDYLALASNTPHLVFDELAPRVGVKMISIVEETCRAIAAAGLRKLGLLGTKSTMSKGFYQRKGEEYGLSILTPSEANQDFVHDKYMNELVFNQINPTTKARLLQIVNDLAAEQQIEGIILGGTELPLILKQADFPQLRVFDTTLIHVEAILNRMLE